MLHSTFAARRLQTSKVEIHFNIFNFPLLFIFCRLYFHQSFFSLLQKWGGNASLCKRCLWWCSRGSLNRGNISPKQLRGGQPSLVCNRCLQKLFLVFEYFNIGFPLWKSRLWNYRMSIFSWKLRVHYTFLHIFLCYLGHWWRFWSHRSNFRWCWWNACEMKGCPYCCLCGNVYEWCNGYRRCNWRYKIGGHFVKIHVWHLGIAIFSIHQIRWSCCRRRNYRPSSRDLIARNSGMGVIEGNSSEKHLFFCLRVSQNCTGTTTKPNVLLFIVDMLQLLLSTVTKTVCKFPPLSCTFHWKNRVSNILVQC